MPHIFHVEHKVLAPTDRTVHPDLMFLYNRPFIKFIPQDAIIKIRRPLHHIDSIFCPVHHAVLLNITLLRDALSDHPVEIRNDHIALMLCGRAHKACHGVRRQPVIAVRKLQIFPSRHGDPLIARIGNTCIFFVQHMDARVPFLVGITE